MKVLLCWTLLQTLSPSGGLWILGDEPLDCSAEGLRCTATKVVCGPGRNIPKPFTPTGPEDVKSAVAIRKRGDDLFPVIVLRWRAQADASIRHLRGIQVHMLKISSNLHFCIRYRFHDKINTSADPEKMPTFLLDRVVVEPDQSYILEVSSLPRQNVNHDNSYGSNFISVPGCHDAQMKTTKICVEQGSVWNPMVNLSEVGDPANVQAVTVEFTSEKRCDKYRVFVECPHFKDSSLVWKHNSTQLRVTFVLEKLPELCCKLDIIIQPFFIQCKNDCIQRRKKFDICPGLNDPPTDVNKPHHKALTVALCGLLLVIVVAFARYGCIQKHWKGTTAPYEEAKPPKDQCRTPKSVLIIYSPDHPLYTAIVLKLCAFLQAKCGIEAHLDLLNMAKIGEIGCLQWLEGQKEQVGSKILLLCSPGMQTKWKAMCENRQVWLREELHSPLGDMLTPAYSLIVPDLLHPAVFGKYIVAYFEDVCMEEDIPSPFHMAVKYKLMSHFEEVCFRILEKEKLESWKINHIEGVGGHEYFTCPTGRALKDAIEFFQLYQSEKPDWFEEECISDIQEHVLLLDHLYEHEQQIQDGRVFVLEGQMKRVSRGDGVQDAFPIMSSQENVIQTFSPNVLGGNLVFAPPVSISEEKAAKHNKLQLEELTERSPIVASSFHTNDQMLPSTRKTSEHFIAQSVIHSIWEHSHFQEFCSNLHLEGRGDKKSWSASDQGYASRSSIQSSSSHEHS